MLCIIAVINMTMGCCNALTLCDDAVLIPLPRCVHHGNSNNNGSAVYSHTYHYCYMVMDVVITLWSFSVNAILTVRWQLCMTLSFILITLPGPMMHYMSGYKIMITDHGMSQAQLYTCVVSQ